MHFRFTARPDLSARAYLLPSPAVVGLSLAGCGLATSYQIANMGPGELTKVSDNDLCRSGTTSNPAVVAERQKRELGDCNPDHVYCHSLGLKPGTDLYVKCRLQAAQIAAQQAAAQQAASAAMVQQGAAMMATPSPPPPPLLLPTTRREQDDTSNTVGSGSWIRARSIKGVTASLSS